MKHLKLPLIIFVIILSLILCQSLCFAWLNTLKGSSMEPTLKNNQKVWVSDYAKGAGPERGDIIIFSVEKSKYLKRVIGLPTEKVVIKKGNVYIISQANPQGEKLNEPYLAPGTVTEPDGEFSVPEGQYFVLGDNRRASRDSRSMGCIPRENVTGKVTKIF